MFEDLSNLIGKTPIIKIHYRYHGEERFLFTKLEMFQLTGSIKDRIAYYMIRGATQKGLLREGAPIVEATSGNTGIALAAQGAISHHPVVIFMPDWASDERVSLMRNYGAQVFLVSKEDGGFEKCIQLASQYAKEHNGYFMNQFQNFDNFLAHYETTGTEIYQQLSGKVSAFVSGVGSGGTLMGVGTFLKEKNPSLKLIAMEPKEMPLLSKGTTFRSHKIEGIGDDFIPDLVQESLIDEIILIHDEDAIEMSKHLARDLGIGVGISSGANFLASVLMNEKHFGNVVTIFADDNKKYLSTELNLECKRNSEFLTNQIELLSFEIVA